MVDNTGNNDQDNSLVNQAQQHLSEIYKKQLGVVSGAFDSSGKYLGEHDPKVVLKALSDATKTVVAATNIKQSEDDSKDLERYRNSALEVIRAAHGVVNELTNKEPTMDSRVLPDIPVHAAVSDAESATGIVKLDIDKFMGN